MIRLGILFNRARAGHLYASNTLAPLLCWRNALADHGIALTFSQDPRGRILDCDAIMVVDYFTNTSTLGARELDLLASLKARGNKVLFFDNTDSCGTTQFEVLAHVDRYVKRQLYRDRGLYERPVYGLRTYCEFFHEKFGVDDELAEERTLLVPAQVHKLSVGWNSGLGPYGLGSRWLRRANQLNYRMGFPVKAQFMGEATLLADEPPSWETRTADVHYRAYANYILRTAAYGREHLDEILDGLAGRYRIRYRTQVSQEQYMQEMRETKAILSPFGYGEICRRDFEAFCAGGVLVKPDMGQVETWPDY